MPSTKNKSKKSKTTQSDKNQALPTIEKKKPWYKTFIMCFWGSDIISLGRKKRKEEDITSVDLPAIEKNLDFNCINNNFKKALQREKKPLKKQIKSYSFILRAILYLVRWKLLAAIIISILTTILQFTNPYIITWTSSYLTDFTLDDWIGAILVIITFCAQYFRTILDQLSNYLSTKNFFESLGGLQALMLEKLLTTKSSSRTYLTSGRIITTAAMDINGIANTFNMLSSVISIPFTIILAIWSIYQQIGVIGFIGPGIMFLMTLTNKKCTLGISNLSKQQMVLMDSKLKLLNEYISGIRIVKYYGWEDIALEKILKIRKEEANVMFKSNLYTSFLGLCFNLIPTCIPLVVFAIYVAMGNVLTPSKAFATISLFSIIQGPINMISWIFTFWATSKVAFQRFLHYLNWEEREAIERFIDSKLPIGSVILKDAEFSWDTSIAKAHDDEYHIRFNESAFIRPPKKKFCFSRKKNQAEEKIREETRTERQNQTNFSPPGDLKGSKESNLGSVLKKINVQIYPEDFIIVIGRVGSGKSSLLSAMLGEMHKIAGQLLLNGKIAYISQEPWLINATLMDNILFGEIFIEQRYREAIRISELEQDISILIAGDQTEIGERGINLSGGQKQRVAIARAIYYQPDIILIDDALSALDSQVGQNILENVFRKHWKNKTRVLVTHNLNCLNHATRIIVMKDGEITNMGTLSELKAQGEECEFFALTSHWKQEAQSENQIEIEKISDEEKNFKPTEEISNEKNREAEIEKGKLLKKEQESGKFSFKVFAQFLSSGGNGLLLVILIISVIVEAQEIASNWWISQWTSDSYQMTYDFYILFYAVIIILGVTANLFSSIFQACYKKYSSINTHRQLLYSIFRSPLGWFDSTPSGEILNRCTRDQILVDHLGASVVTDILGPILGLIFQIIVISTIIPYFFAVIGVVTLLNIYFSVRYGNVAQPIKNLNSSAYSPLITTIMECASGYQIIRTYKKEQLYIEKLRESYNFWVKVLSSSMYIEIWLNLRTGFIAALASSISTLFLVITKYQENTVSQANAGLSLTYSLQFSMATLGIINYFTRFNVTFNSVYRVYQLINKKEVEADWKNPKPENNNWPEVGTLVATDISYKYRHDLPLAVKSVNFSLEKGEKVGVVGRTGSGKSTLTLGLLRILEIDDNEGENKKGNIKIDGLDIKNIGLHHLRQKITIIPQTPVLFSGTLRDNLDPKGLKSDEELIDALRKVHIIEDLTEMYKVRLELKMEENKEENSKLEQGRKKRKEELAKIFQLPEGDLDLYMEIKDSGSNFSVGQKQLISIARALVQKPKILLMDEATSSIDEKTDLKIQAMIKTEFKDSSVFTIAHRLNTIIQYDKIIVMEDGRCVEFGSPFDLLKNKSSLFTEIVKSSGIESEKNLKGMAAEAKFGKDINMNDLFNE